MPVASALRNACQGRDGFLRRAMGRPRKIVKPAMAPRSFVVARFMRADRPSRWQIWGDHSNLTSEGQRRRNREYDPSLHSDDKLVNY